MNRFLEENLYSNVRRSRDFDNAKYVESLEEVLQLENSFPKKLPIPADGGRAISSKKGADTPLTPEDHHLYRKGVGILLYLAPERPDLMFALKKLSMKLASPSQARPSRGICWATKTSSTGQPFAVTLTGVTGRDIASAWVLTGSDIFKALLPRLYSAHPAATQQPLTRAFLVWSPHVLPRHWLL